VLPPTEHTNAWQVLILKRSPFINGFALELARFGSNIRGHLFIQLHTLHTHYLTIVVTDRGYRFALIALSTSSEGPNSYSVMEDFGWIDSSKLSFAHRSNELILGIAHSHKFSSFTATNPHSLHDLIG
jgi:hypothetical protein